MTRIDFHSNVPDKTAYACRLVRKARAANCRIVILA
ncbi:MAG TPA: DNA polymerase III subunit chi, partial [Burkholderiaceae bacterium]|nr:DNA polymerase III subunit chi [Burkholderiaceae bacterium]